MNSFTNKKHVLVVDDDRRIRQLVAQYLMREDYVVMTAENADDALTMIGQFEFDILVVDVMMPGKTGFELIETLQKKHLNPPPSLLLTARGEAEDRIRGLEVGADDYLVKPFEPKELSLRLRAILKRVMTQEQYKDKIKFGPYTFTISTKRLQKQDGVVISLSSGEQELLSLFAQKNNEILTRHEIMVALGGEDQNERTIDVQINRLRKKIEKDSKVPQYLQTIRGKGYILHLD